MIKRGFSFVYVLVFAIVSVSSAIVILLAYSIVSDTPINELVPDSVGNLIGSTNSNNQNNSEGFLGGFLGGLFGGNKQSSGGGGGGGGPGGGTGGNPPGDNNNTNQTYLVCVNNTCAIVNGSGVNECLSVGESCNVMNQTHLACVNNTCTVLNGTGNNECSTTGELCNIISGNVDYITPGNGWTGLTSQPANTGNGPKAIARWDVVPYQTIKGEYGIGVVAFHINGIDRVEFSVENGSWVSVTEMTYNPYSKVWEYWVKMNANEFSDGLKEIRAIAYPEQGIPRVLQGPIDGTVDGNNDYSNGNHAMFLSTNAHNALVEPIVWVDSVNGNDVNGNGSEYGPYKTVGKALAGVRSLYDAVDGTTIYLEAGDYIWNSIDDIFNPNKRWVTITPAPGITREQVRFVDSSTGGLRTKLVRAFNITETVRGGPRRTTSNKDAYFWFDTSFVRGFEPDDRWFDSEVTQGPWSGVYITDSGSYGASQPFRSSTFIRNSVTEHGSRTPFGKGFIVNVRGDDWVRVPPNGHTDIVHWYWNHIENPGPENYIVYGLEVTNFETAGFRVNPINTGNQRFDNIAFVNIHISKDQEQQAVDGTNWGIDTNHLLIYNLQSPDQPFDFNDHSHDLDGFLTLTNVAIRNSIFLNIRGFNSNNGSLPANSTVEHVHVMHCVNGLREFLINELDLTCGENNGGTTVEELFVNPAGLDYRPKPGSVIYSRVFEQDLVVPADIDGLRVTRLPASLGSFSGG